MKNQLLFVLFLCIHINMYAQVPEWLVSNPGMGEDLAIDQFNNTFTCGQFVGTASFDDYNFTSNGAQDIIVAKYSPSGALLWATTFGGSGSDFVSEIVYDGYGSVWVTGQFTGTFEVSGNQYPSYGGTDIFLIKMNAANGDIAFFKQLGGTGNDSAEGLECDQMGNIIISGIFISNFSYGAFYLTGPSYEVFILKLDTTGGILWGNQISGSNIESIWCSATDNDDNIYLAGLTSSATVQFSGQSVSFLGTKKFVAKLDSEGNTIWVTKAQFTGEIYSISTDALGNVYGTGNFDSNAIFGPFEHTSAGNDDIFVFKINPEGNYQWASRYGGTGIDSGYEMVCNAEGEVVVAGYFQASFSIGNTPVSASGNMKSFLFKTDTDGNVLWVMQTSGTSLSSHYIRGMAIDENNVLYVSGVGGENLIFGGLETILTGGFLIKMADNTNVIHGYVFHDSNGNAEFDNDETGIQNIFVSLNNGLSVAATGSDGEYQIFTNEGSHTVNIQNIPPYYNATTTMPVSVEFTGMGNTSYNNNFGLQAVAEINDLLVDIEQITVAKAGYVLAYLISCKNMGTTAIDATLMCNTDYTMSYLYSSPAHSGYNGPSIVWNLGTLEPQQNASNFVYFNIPQNALIDDEILTTANIIPVENDENPINNTFQHNTVVVGPFDPNYKTVNISEINDVSQPDWLEYTIHFQNIGNHTAYNVLIIDTLSSFLNLPDFELISSSFPVIVNFSQQAKMELRFENIMLPDSASDPLGSCGFVKFRIKYKTTIPLNDSITNCADIYFDYQPAIRTNTAVTHYRESATIKKPRTETLLLSAFPNPAANDLYLQIELPKNTTCNVAIYSINYVRLMNFELPLVLGNNTVHLDISNFDSGMYVIVVTTSSRNYYRRIIKT